MLPIGIHHLASDSWKKRAKQASTPSQCLVGHLPRQRLVVVYESCCLRIRHVWAQKAPGLLVGNPFLPSTYLLALLHLCQHDILVHFKEETCAIITE